MIKNVTWQRAEVHDSELAEWLTKANFQPGKFLLIPWPLSKKVTIIYAESETNKL